MTALTAAYDAKRKDGKLVAQPLVAGARVFKGALVAVVTASGLAQAVADIAGTVSRASPTRPWTTRAARGRRNPCAS